MKVDDDLAFLSAGGELARLVRAHPWDRTTLGPLREWSATLKSAVAILLRSSVPMAMLWGPDGVMIYNDAYSAIAGERHPQLLGSRVREGWPEVADFNDHVMRVVLAGGTLGYQDQELTLYRHGRPEQVFMNLDYSPVVDEAARAVGVLCVLAETTGTILATRRQQAAEAALRRERDRAQDVLDRMAEGFILFDHELRVFDINPEGMRFETRPREEIIGRLQWEAWPGTADSEMGRLCRRAMAERVPVAIEHHYVWEDGRDAWFDMRAYPTASPCSTATGPSGGGATKRNWRRRPSRRRSSASSPRA